MFKKKVYFISDAHFGIDLQGYNDRESLFFQFLEREASSMDALYILGDLFDFWVEYRCAIRPDYFPVLHHLKNLVDSGVPIHYLAGNHDFALGPFLTDTIGIRVYPGVVQQSIQGKRVVMYHGDGLLRHDKKYRILKKILRNRINQRLYKMLHPNIGVPLGSIVSGSSRKYLNKPLGKDIRDEYAACARRNLHQGHDIVLYGHIHIPEYICWPEGIYCNTGAWLQHLTYATLANGTLRLLRYQEGGVDVELSASVQK